METITEEVRWRDNHEKERRWTMKTMVLEVRWIEENRREERDRR